MADLQLKQDTFVPREYPKPVLEFDKIIQKMQTAIQIRIHKSLLDRVLEFCTYDHFAADGDAHYIVNFPFIDNEYYYDILLGFGDKCECLAPSDIRAKIKQKIHDMDAVYSGKCP